MNEGYPFASSQESCAAPTAPRATLGPMGAEARCTVRHGGRASVGKALLETDQIVFRGDFRLTIPFREITSLTVADGQLVVAFGGETATFELGASAERWADRIRKPKTLLDKMGVRPGMRLSLVGVPDAPFRELLRERGIDFANGQAAAGSNVVVLGAERLDDLARLHDLKRIVARDGAIWIVSPKGGREPREADVLAAGKDAGLVDTKVVRFSDTHTAHKFVIPVAQR